jgi:putative two-component system response regulator
VGVAENPLRIARDAERVWSEGEQRTKKRGIGDAASVFPASRSPSSLFFPPMKPSRADSGVSPVPREFQSAFRARYMSGMTILVTNVLVWYDSVHMKSIRKKVIMVDDNIINLTLGKSILSHHYDIYTAPSGEKLFKLLEAVKPDILLLDIEMPDMNGYEVIKRLKAFRETAHIPVVFLTIRNDNNSELEGLNLGAVDYITKPFSPALLLKRIEMHLLLESQKNTLKIYNKELETLVLKKTETILGMQNSMFNTVVDLIEFRDASNKGHLQRTYQYLTLLVRAMQESGIYHEEIAAWNDVETVLKSSQLHDIGKISISTDILLKAGKLTEAEFEEMKKHTVYGVEIIGKLEEDAPGYEFFKYAKLFAGTHHERWDGKGYPYGLQGEAIPVQGRLMAIADVYDALVSKRLYNAMQSHQEVVRCIKEGRGTQFDPELTDLFLTIADGFEKVLEKEL